MSKITSPLGALVVCAVAGVLGIVNVGAVRAQPSAQPSQAQPQNATVPAATTNNGPASNPSPSAAPASAASNRTASDASSKAVQAGARRICRTTPQTGTRLRALRTCRTEDEWRQSASETQKAVRVMQGRGGVPTVN